MKNVGISPKKLTSFFDPVPCDKDFAINFLIISSDHVDQGHNYHYSSNMCFHSEVLTRIANIKQCVSVHVCYFVA